MLHTILVSQEARRVLAAREIGAVYKMLVDAGVSQRIIAQSTGQSQSEVCEIIKGRPVRQVQVLERVADGLGVDRAWLGVSHSSGYAGSVTESADEVDDPVKRRAFLAAASAAVWGQPVLGELLDLPAPGDVPLPLRLGMTDVQSIEDMTGRFRELARQHGGHAAIVSDTATRSARLVSVNVTEPVRQRLTAALADLHALAGWCAYDELHDDHARWHYRQALGLTTEPPQVAVVLQLAGICEGAGGAFNDGLKLYQLSQVKSDDPTLTSWGHGMAAHALAEMGHQDQARSELAAARDKWDPPNAAERADMDYNTALVSARLGDVDTAEQFVSVVNGAGRHRPVGVLATVLRARLHVQAREPDGLTLARRAITDVSALRSARARQRLAPLVTALASRLDSDARELAQQARRVAAARA